MYNSSQKIDKRFKRHWTHNPVHQYPFLGFIDKCFLDIQRKEYFLSQWYLKLIASVKVTKQRISLLWQDQHLWYLIRLLVSSTFLSHNQSCSDFLPKFFFFQLCLNIIETTTQHTSRVRTNKWIYNWMRNVATNADTLTHIKMINWSNLQCTHLACGLEILERCIRSQFKQNLGLICTKLSNSQDTVHIFIGISNSMLELNFTWKAKNNVRKLECSSIK